MSGKISPCERCGLDGAETIFGQYQACKRCDAPAVPEPVEREKTDKYGWALAGLDAADQDYLKQLNAITWPTASVATHAVYKCAACGQLQTCDIDWVANGGKSGCCKYYLRRIP